jgi:F-type H+-transporting ATPase subunit delta
MSSLTTLARPYAKAAFDLAEAGDNLAGWDAALKAAALVASDDTMADWLISPELDQQQALGIFSEAAGANADAAFGRFLAVLADNGRLPLLPQVSIMFGDLREAAEGRLNVQVISAVPLDEDQSSRMSAALKKRFECDIELHNDVDASVLGGAIIYAGDQVIDGTLKGRLAKLENSLA